MHCFTKFLLLAAVILPLLPNVAIGPFLINPFKTWLVVVAVSGVSYGSYVLQRLTAGKGGVLLAALVGGAYSSTVTTVVLSRQSRDEAQPRLYAGAILIASGMMYLRLGALLALFNQALMSHLLLSFLLLGGAAIIAGWAWSQRGDTATQNPLHPFESKNPLEISAALLFAILFVVMLIATRLAIEFLGAAGVYTLAAVTGVTDVDPIIMGMTQSAPALTPVSVAATAILIAAASNNLAKGMYAYTIARGKTGQQGLIALWFLGICGLLPLLWV